MTDVSCSARARVTHQNPEIGRAQPRSSAVPSCRAARHGAVVIAVFGAGAIGCWVGGRLAAAGHDVTLIGRARVMDELADGLTTSELDGPPRTVRVTATTDPAAAAGAEIVLVTVKSAQTAEAGATLAAVLP